MRRKKITAKKILKIVGGALVFLTLPTLLLYAFIYLKYNEELPNGTSGPEADNLAQGMLQALNYEAYKKTDYIEWTFKGRHHYKWQRSKNKCTVQWKDFKIDLDLNDQSKSIAYVHNFRVYEETAQELIDKAQKYFNNDSFWLVAPYKVFDPGVERKLVKTTENGDALLITYTSGGSTPGDSYLWILDKNKRPESFKMWVSILPINGLPATWNDWKVTESGAILPNFHKILLLGLEIQGLKTARE